MVFENDTLLALDSTSLTALELLSTARSHHPNSDTDSKAACITTEHQLPQLSQLRFLRIAGDRFDASVLACMPQLEKLVLQECFQCPTYNDVLLDEGVTEPEEALLKALAKLQHLRHLELCWAFEVSDDLIMREEARPRPSDDALYAALTASSHLTSLKILTRTHHGCGA
jgi:hypothetical protein